MLSRIAESLFWIGRYVERADSTARIADVHLQLMLEDQSIEEELACRSLLAIMGCAAPEGESTTQRDVLRLLAVDRDQPASIAHSLNAARENARRAREIISSDVWECLNTTRMRMPRHLTSEQAHQHFGWVRDRTAMTLGMIESATSRDETWQFFTLGRTLERADMTARMVATRSMPTRPSWTTILWSCGAYEVFLRTYRGAPKTSNAAEFLMLDRLFPRSVLYSLNLAERCLQRIDPAEQRAGVSDPGRRRIGRLRTELEYLPVSDLVANLTGYVDAVQESTLAISDAIRQRYFPSQAVPVWIGDRT